MLTQNQKETFKDSSLLRLKGFLPADKTDQSREAIMRIIALIYDGRLVRGLLLLGKDRCVPTPALQNRDF